METLMIMVLFIFMAVIAVAMAMLRSLIAVVVLAGIFSFLSASVFVLMDAVDVAFTEAAVGAGISTVLMLGTLGLTVQREHKPVHKPLLPLIVTVITGAILIWGTWDMPRFGDRENPIHKHLVPRYIEQSDEEIGVPNIVTSVLASYRGYDTLGETTVVFTAGIGVMIILMGRRRKDAYEPENEETAPGEALADKAGADRQSAGSGKPEETVV